MTIKTPFYAHLSWRWPTRQPDSEHLIRSPKFKLLCTTLLSQKMCHLSQKLRCNECSEDHEIGMTSKGGMSQNMQCSQSTPRSPFISCASSQFGPKWQKCSANDAGARDARNSPAAIHDHGMMGMCFAVSVSSQGTGTLTPHARLTPFNFHVPKLNLRHRRAAALNGDRRHQLHGSTPFMDIPSQNSGVHHRHHLTASQSQKSEGSYRHDIAEVCAVRSNLQTATTGPTNSCPTTLSIPYTAPHMDLNSHQSHPQKTPHRTSSAFSRIRDLWNIYRSY